MDHHFYKKSYCKTKKGVYPKWIVTTPAEKPTRSERRASWSNMGRMNTRGQFRFGRVGSIGIYLMERYLSGRNMARHPGWFGWKKHDGADVYRERMKKLRHKAS